MSSRSCFSSICGRPAAANAKESHKLDGLRRIPQTGRIRGPATRARLASQEGTVHDVRPAQNPPKDPHAQRRTVRVGLSRPVWTVSVWTV